MKRTLTTLALGILVSMAGRAATTSTALTVNATTAINITTGSITATGSAELTNLGTGSFSGSLGSATGDTLSAPFTIALPGGTLTGTLSIPAALLSPSVGSGTASATITGGTGSYERASGSFPKLDGIATGSLISGFTLKFQGDGTITTPGSGGGPQTPVPAITAVQDAGSYTANIAQGSMFVIKGSNLSPTDYKAPSALPLPAELDGVKITFTPVTGGAGKSAYLVYIYNQGNKSQLAGVVPSSLPLGSYNVTVTNGASTSAPFAVTVVAHKVGIFTQDQSGSGLAVIQNYISQGTVDVNRLTTGSVNGSAVSPAKPGQVLIAWGTGLGAIAGGDDVGAPVYNFAANGVDVRVLVGGMSIVPDYAGRAPGYVAEDQINFTLPPDVPTGCAVPFQVSVDGVLSAPATIAIAPNSSAGACVEPGYTTQDLRDFDNGKSITLGMFSLSQQTLSLLGASVKLNSAAGSFTRITGFQIGAAAEASAQMPVNTTDSCRVMRRVINSGGGTGILGSVKNLDAGAITLNGPGASNIANLAFKQDADTNSYSITFASEGSPVPLPGASNGTIVAGTYTLNGTGGKDVGKFNASLTIGAPITVTLPSAVNRSAGLTLNWTGGNPSDLVQISGTASQVTGTGTSRTTDSTSFYCTTTAGQGTFTVPASVLQQLPQVSATSNSSNGSLSVLSTPKPATFQAPLTAGGEISPAYFLALIGTSSAASYQ